MGFNPRFKRGRKPLFLFLYRYGEKPQWPQKSKSAISRSAASVTADLSTA
nr:MAG TPA: hypothetical protein [Caudoviricetes sp.]